MKLKQIFTLKRVILFIVYSSIIIFLGTIVYMFLSTKITLTKYKPDIVAYDHDIDSIFQPQILQQIKFENVHKSDVSGTIYFASIKSSKIAIIQPVNFTNINLENLRLTKIRKISISQAKTYYSIANIKFPYIYHALNPKKSTFIKCFVGDNSEIKLEFGNGSFHYVFGNYGLIALGNSQKSSIISFPKKHNNEVLILKSNNKLYFLFQTREADSLFDFVNPDKLH